MTAAASWTGSAAVAAAAAAAPRRWHSTHANIFGVLAMLLCLFSGQSTARVAVTVDKLAEKTLVPHDYTADGWTPSPTPGPYLRSELLKPMGFHLLLRQASGNMTGTSPTGVFTTISTQVIGTRTVEPCGYYYGSDGELSIQNCGYPFTCAYFASANALGCASGTSGGVVTSCVNGPDVSASCGESCLANTYITLCTSASSQFCGTVVFTNYPAPSGLTPSALGCAATPGLFVGSSVVTLSGTVFSANPPFSTSTITLPGTVTSPLSTTIPTPSSSTFPPTPTPNPSHSDAGAIAGGVVGGVVGAALLAGLAFFFWRRSNKKRREQPPPGNWNVAPPGGQAYAGNYNPNSGQPPYYGHSNSNAGMAQPSQPLQGGIANPYPTQQYQQQQQQQQQQQHFGSTGEAQLKQQSPPAPQSPPEGFPVDKPTYHEVDGVAAPQHSEMPDNQARPGATAGEALHELSG